MNPIQMRAAKILQRNRINPYHVFSQSDKIWAMQFMENMSLNHSPKLQKNENCWQFSCSSSRNPHRVATAWADNPIAAIAQWIVDNPE